ncbi:hypothetical protein V501_00725 [Pseudogymnoascus sp. VKM F-4519 (FW-2642)]|nr:hypothetical protein V501_00725 [Pseudogymnoascus sp. VKM F-4519 (FW-2642)]
MQVARNRRGSSIDLLVLQQTIRGRVPEGLLPYVLSDNGDDGHHWQRLCMQCPSSPSSGEKSERTTMPGGSNPSYNKGITLVHEVGHWLGLYNTFEGGCKAPGDYVNDTPFQLTASVGCPIGIDTCPQDGADPVENYMDTSDDACRNHFTPGQAKRIAQIAKQYRGINL